MRNDTRPKPIVRGVTAVTGNLSNFFALARWISALLVVIFHTRQLVFPRFVDLDHTGVGLKMLYAVTSFGHEAVIVFFVLSGFLVGGINLDRVQHGTFSPKGYFVHRFCRIYIVLIPAMFLTLIFDAAGFLFLKTSPYYSLPRSGHGYLPLIYDENLGLSVFVGNLLMLYGIAAPKFGTNGPVWSLAAEFWYYLLFGFAMIAFSAQRWVAKAAAVCVALVIVAIVPLPTLLIGIAWIVGIMAHRLVVVGQRGPKISLALIVFFAALLISKRCHPPGNFEGVSDLASLLCDILVAAAFAILTISIASDRRMTIPFARLNHMLADFSYSIYLIHYPVVVLCCATIYHVTDTKPFSVISASTFCIALTAIAAAYVVAILNYLMFEKHTSALTSWVSRFFHQKQPLARASSHAIVLKS